MPTKRKKTSVRKGTKRAKQTHDEKKQAPKTSLTANQAHELLRDGGTVAIECRGRQYDWITLPVLRRALAACIPFGDAWMIGQATGGCYIPSTPEQYARRCLEKRAYSRMIVYNNASTDDEVSSLWHHVGERFDKEKLYFLGAQELAELKNTFPEHVRAHAPELVGTGLVGQRPPTPLSCAPWSRILPNLYVSDRETATDAKFLAERKIHCVVSLGETIASLPGVEEHLQSPSFADCEERDVLDAMHTFLGKVVPRVSQLLDEDKTCLVHCGAGISRAATVAIGILQHHLKLTLREAYVLLCYYRPWIDPHPAFLHVVQNRTLGLGRGRT